MIRQRIQNPEILKSNNRIKGDQDGDTVADYTFDSSGNTTKQANGNTFIYDAENKQIEVKNSSNVTIGQYWYDGDGKRVKKYVPGTGETTIFVYDALGKLIGEYSTLLNPTPQVSYLTNDHLGSPRINTNENGTVIARHDYHPFGEEITGGLRTVTLGYATDDNRKQFTGYERDDESGLDFAQARYFGSMHGRFTSPDVPFADQIEEDPQSWNLYSYVRNNPLIYTDPLGLWIQVECLGGATLCYMAEPGDTYASLSEETGFSEDNLREYFQNQEIVEGSVFDVSGYSDWVKQGPRSNILMPQRELNDLIHRQSNMEPPGGGGIRNVAKAVRKTGLLSKAWRWGKKLFGFADEASSSAKSLAQYQKLKQLYRRLMSKPPVDNPELQKLMDALYRPGATVGSGSTAAAVAQEAATGQPVGGVFHLQKAKDYIVGLEKWLKNNPSASPGDRHAAEQVILDLRDALQ